MIWANYKEKKLCFHLRALFIYPQIVNLELFEDLFCCSSLYTPDVMGYMNFYQILRRTLAND